MRGDPVKRTPIRRIGAGLPVDQPADRAPLGAVWDPAARLVWLRHTRGSSWEAHAVPVEPADGWQNASGTIEPSRITTALDRWGMSGAWVDVALGVDVDGQDVGTVDRWETGEQVPTWEQLGRLATLTHMPIGWFTRAPVPEVGVAHICERIGS